MVNCRRTGPKESTSLASATFAQPLRTPSQSQPTTSDSEKVAATPTQTSGNGGSSFFALPVHTEELGRLPLHPGFSGNYPQEWAQGTAPQQQQPQQSQQQQQQHMPPMASSSAPRTPAPGASGNPFDPRVLSMFNTPGPSGFSEMFATPPPSAATDGPAYPSPFVQEMHTLAAAGAGAGTGGGDAAMSGISAQELAFADNTLDMWSTAPTGFE